MTWRRPGRGNLPSGSIWRWASLGSLAPRGLTGPRARLGGAAGVRAQRRRRRSGRDGGDRPYLGRGASGRDRDAPVRLAGRLSGGAGPQPRSPCAVWRRPRRSRVRPSRGRSPGGAGARGTRPRQPPHQGPRGRRGGLGRDRVRCREPGGQHRARSSPTPWASCPPRGPIARSTRPTRCGATGTAATSGSESGGAADDVANLVPARLGAAVLAAGAALAGEDGRGAAAWRGPSTANASRTPLADGGDGGRARRGPRETRRLPARRGRAPSSPMRSAGRGRSWAGRPRSPSCWRRASRSCGGTDPRARHGRDLASPIEGSGA